MRLSKQQLCCIDTQGNRACVCCCAQCLPSSVNQRVCATDALSSLRDVCVLCDRHCATARMRQTRLSLLSITHSVLQACAVREADPASEVAAPKALCAACPCSRTSFQSERRDVRSAQTTFRAWRSSVHDPSVKHFIRIDSVRRCVCASCESQVLHASAHRRGWKRQIEIVVRQRS